MVLKEMSPDPKRYSASGVPVSVSGTGCDASSGGKPARKFFGISAVASGSEQPRNSKVVVAGVARGGQAEGGASPPESAGVLLSVGKLPSVEVAPSLVVAPSAVAPASVGVEVSSPTQADIERIVREERNGRTPKTVRMRTSRP
jgi:hypothetical protein